METQQHRVGQADYRQLLHGQGGPDAITLLNDGERSWRILLLRALADATEDAVSLSVTGPLPPLKDGWRLLTRAWRTAPAEVERLLLYPAVGTWAAHTLRRVRGTASGDSPLWAETGYLHAVAASAATLAGLDFRTSVPVRDGWAVLPCLGGTRVRATASPWGSVDVVATAGTVKVGPVAVGADGWHWLRELRADGHTLLLDDIDPYRGLREPRSPEPVDPATAARWGELFAEAWKLLDHDDPEAAGAAAAGLRSVVPRPRSERYRPHSASSGDAFGAVLASEPDDAEQFACTLVHEFQHHKLGAFMHLFTLHEDGGPERFYAPWRDDPRPLGGLLQGVYAFFGVTRYWRGRRQLPGDLAEFEYALWREQTLAALHGIRPAQRLSSLGRELVDELTQCLTAWSGEVVDPRARDAAALAAADHRATWRAHHLQPPTDAVARAAHSYSPAGDVPVVLPSAEGTLVPAKPQRGLDTRAVLLRRLLMDGTVTETVEGARPEDIALVTGDHDTARARFTDRILHVGGADPDAWSGLGLALRAQGHPAAEVLLRRPEFVMAVHAALSQDTDTDPVRLAIACSPR
ncbi:HEXXH motif domain-containing protein [Streptomyces sp. MBT65]|uniref:HEXXH motif domain-containing protein n=1 Tax=Streptomyces sp. MBT65 TaxID=1488395 RepID=UPI0019099A5C|nr:HEXXH motif domain-containing protein [Streptomyces sp. MBT65]MBK3578273.1 HEXXH motif domain-containing protein [Streptomyces sp. MBT65]